MTVRLDFLVATTLAGITAAMPHMAISVEKFEKPNIIFSKAAEPPNVVFLLVDDMGYGDIAAHGNPVLKTPNFDKLHDQSARFTNFCVSPTCAPTRAALLTGKHEFESWVVHTIPPGRNMNPETLIIPQLFKAKGYKTAIFGKWHLGQEGAHAPWRRGFDETLNAICDTQDHHFDPILLKNGKKKQYKGYRTDIFFEAAMEYIEANRNKPFFVYLATYSPHRPHKVPGKYSAPYREDAKRLKGKGKVVSKNFFGMVANVDENLGRLMAHLEKLNLADNTLLIVMNDNGGTHGVDIWNSGMRGTKGMPWLGGVRAYSFWRLGKMFKPGSRTQMSGHVDLLPTLADICDLEIPNQIAKELEGRSLYPVLEKAHATLPGQDEHMQVHHLGRWGGNRTTNWQVWRKYKYTGCVVRWKNYYLVRAKWKNRRTQYSKNPDFFRDTDGWALYDIDMDLYQSHNIADQHPKIVKAMSDHYEAWWAKAAVVLKNRYGDE